MQFESRWSSDDIAASFYPADDREDTSFEDLGSRSSDCPAPSSERRPQCAAINWGIRHKEPVQWLSKPNPWGRRVAAEMSRVVELVIEGLALSAATLHAEFLLPPAEPAHRRDLSEDRPDGRHADTAPTDFAVWRARITAIIVELWSKMRREREIRRIGAAWETIDDRTLNDIGISRYEIEFARDERHWS